jgi:hypothetical protein
MYHDAIIFNTYPIVLEFAREFSRDLTLAPGDCLTLTFYHFARADISSRDYGHRPACISLSSQRQFDQE